MIVFHGTTLRRANRIQAEGFRAKSPSRRIWFAKHKAYALRRARHKARGSHDSPVVLMCDLDIEALRATLGSKNVRVSGGIVAVDGHVPSSMLAASTGITVPSRRDQLRVWMNRLLGLAPHEGVGAKDPGLDRLARWLDQRIASNPEGELQKGELLKVSAQCMPEYFRRARPDFRRVTEAPEPTDPEESASEPDADDERSRTVERALGLLESEKPPSRVEGLALLRESGDLDLFEWCALLLDDESVTVQVAALEAMSACDGIDSEMVRPCVDAKDRQIRAAAIATLVKHSEERPDEWLRYGLTDPEPHVRVTTARQLARLDLSNHRAILDLALNDSHPEVVRIAKRAKKG